jgi:hypothetical protein
MRLENNEVKHKDDDAEVAMMINPQRKTASLASVLASSLPSRPTQLESQHRAPPYEDGKPDDLQFFHQD